MRHLDDLQILDKTVGRVGIVSQTHLGMFVRHLFCQESHLAGQLLIFPSHYAFSCVF